jgi:hypothetical protein
VRIEIENVTGDFYNKIYNEQGRLVYASRAETLDQALLMIRRGVKDVTAPVIEGKLVPAKLMGSGCDDLV